MQHFTCTQERLRASVTKFEFRECLAAWIFWFLQVIPGLHDALLAIPVIRSLSVYAALPRCRAFLETTCLLRPANLKTTFDNIPYFVGDEAKKLLIHASEHVLATRPEHQRYLSSLPQLNQILLSVPENNRRYQAGVAEALASHLGASLLMVDSDTVSAIADVALGGGGAGGEKPTEAGDERDLKDIGAMGFFAYFVSFFISGGRYSFAFDTLREVCKELGGPLIMLVKDIDTTLCSDLECWYAFSEAFGITAWESNLGRSNSEYASVESVPNMVVIGGTSLSEAGAAVLAGQRKAKGDTAKNSAAEAVDSRASLGDRGADANGLPSLLPSPAELGLPLLDDLSPDARQCVPEAPGSPRTGV
eukprot:gene18351-21888_t